MTEIALRIDPHPENEGARRAAWEAAWGDPGHADFSAILARSLVHLGAYDGAELVGFVNVAWDCGIHAFLLDPTVHPDHRRTGLGTRLVTEAARPGGGARAQRLHVDYEPHLAGFYERCGFRPSTAWSGCGLAGD